MKTFSIDARVVKRCAAKAQYVLLTVLVLGSSYAFAQRCPPDHYPIGGAQAGWVGCAPMHPQQPQPSAAPPAPRPYVPPPPPRGWESRFTGFVSFKVGEDEDRESRGFRNDFAIAMNFATEAEARAAVAEMCRKRVLRVWESHNIDNNCESRATVVRGAFITVAVGEYNDFRVYEAPDVKRAAAHYGLCAKRPEPWHSSCTSYLFGIGRNGSHREPANPGEHRIYTCPNGPTNKLSKVVGVDRLSGSDVPLCGPDITAITLQDREGKWDAYATHPRYVLPFAMGGFTELAAAQKAVLDRCNSFTGGGCQPAGQHQNGFAVWVRNDEGKLFLGTGADEAAALADGRRTCDVGQLLPCKKVITRIAGDLNVYTPSDKGHFHYFGAVALPQGRVGKDLTAWYSRNMPSQAEAERYALQACQSQNLAKVPCTIVARGLGTQFFGYSGLDGSRGVFALLEKGANTLTDTDNRRAAALKAVCASRGTLCKIEGGGSASDGGEGREPSVSTTRWPSQ